MRRLLLLLTLLSQVAIAQPDYPGAHWDPAHSSNFTVSSRPTSTPIQYVVIHIMEGYYNGSISWFKNPSSDVSAHYLLRSSDGDITQMVREKDIAWHAGNWTYNTRSIGIEHEGFGNNPAWLTPIMYQSSAALTRTLTNRYGIPRDRTRILGHREVPGASTGCPGNHWNWDTYMTIVQLDGAFESATVPTSMGAGETRDVVVRFRNTGDLTWASVSGTSQVVLGTQNPQDRSSPFATGTWLSSSRPAAVFASTAAGAVGEFRFRMVAPQTPGNYTEAFQMRRDDGNWFGAIVTFQITVTEAGTVIDNSDAAFSAKGAWKTGAFATGKYGADYRFADTSSNVLSYADWNLNVPANGHYDVFAWWSQGTNRSTQARFSVLHHFGTSSLLMNQQTLGGQWVHLGRYFMRAGTGKVRLSANAPSGKVVIADAVRFAGPY
ncbi:MAG TPA: N-acetylmuramoyl-L-alanine amidase [Fimbriimonadaceae bacterium]|nr:N-acetylmuramoyl-L-alanine amidase [Fimbriimonadaceae bacterium]